MTARRRSALVLLLSLLAGGIIAPLTHYVFMEVSGSYASPAHHGAMQLAARPGDGHAAHLQHAENSVLPVGPNLQQSEQAVLHCSYADLFATYAAAIGGESQSNGLSAVSLFSLLAPEVPAAEVVQFFRSRAPPQV